MLYMIDNFGSWLILGFTIEGTRIWLRVLGLALMGDHS